MKQVSKTFPKGTSIDDVLQYVNIETINLRRRYKFIEDITITIEDKEE